MMKVTTFTAYDKHNNKYKWAFWRETAYKEATGLWVLRDHTGYSRTLEHTWIDSVPLIHLILENHGMTANIS